MKQDLLQLWADWKFRRRYHSRVVRDLVHQIEWRLAMVQSITPDVSAAYNLSRLLKEKISQ